MYKLNPNLKSFWKTRKPYKLLKGGRFSSKTQDAGGMAAFLARNYSLRFLCLRQFQNRISDSVYTVIKNKIEAAGWTNEFDIGVSSIKHKTTGSEFLFYGIARNIAEIKGTEDIDICWIEEGEGLTELQWEVIDPTIRKENAEVWILWNPDSVADFVQTKLPRILGDSAVIRHVNYDENPFISDSARAKAERLKVVDRDTYDHIYLGIPTDNSDSSLIKRSWIEASIDAHITLDVDMSGINRSALDIADTGKDKNAQSFFDGLILKDIQQWSGKDTGDIYATTEKAFQNCVDNALDSFLYDADGMGAGVRGDARKINEGRVKVPVLPIEAIPFYGSGEVVFGDQYFIDPTGESKGITNRKYFSNYKAQSWWSLRERFRKTHQAIVSGGDFNKDDLISISSDCSFLDDLKTELSTPRRKTGSPKFTVDKSPDDMPSPNLADAIMMAMAPTNGGSSLSSVLAARKARRR